MRYVATAESEGKVAPLQNLAQSAVHIAHRASVHIAHIASARSDAFRDFQKIFTERVYQDKLLERAKKENIICALGTGAGKTYIAAVSVPLVEHQSAALTRLTGMPIEKYCGSVGVDGLESTGTYRGVLWMSNLVMVHALFL
ncbi:hypothetical protein BV898_00542 [Hypsibius exemplaris]|uniref:Uncharacterized protein n=1 Tax=Hypsibius exemplaris TaxID=2072580 RepID=A0A1W0XDQ3_HYPEX|nr:hypothetical protein BV898_00542 [Hypsibius exemplaris]